MQFGLVCQNVFGTDWYQRLVIKSTTRLLGIGNGALRPAPTHRAAQHLRGNFPGG